MSFQYTRKKYFMLEIGILDRENIIGPIFEINELGIIEGVSKGVFDMVKGLGNELEGLKNSKLTSSKQYIKLCDYFLFFYKKVNEFNNDVNNNSLSIDEFINKYKISFKTT